MQIRAESRAVDDAPPVRPRRSPFGAQVWLERDATPDRVSGLLRRAAECGLGQVRLFLMWPWIEAQRGHWQFDLFDAAFDAAAQYELGVKATLTANSGPWWLGTGGVLHTHTMTLAEDQRPAVREYVSRCVLRYRDHPALDQWILWNEPINSAATPDSPITRTTEMRELWADVLRHRYSTVEALNRRWLTGYQDFADVPFAEEITHPAHRRSPWRSFGPVLDDFALRSAVLGHELTWVADVLREHDPVTPTCINPNGTMANLPQAGYRMADLARTADVLGASFHAPWTFGFAPPTAHLPLVVAGLSLLQTVPGAEAVEVTELQLGNTFLAGNTPVGVRPAQVAANFLAPHLAGAETVTGWLLNTRGQDFEAGDWGLLDDDDRLSGRAEAVARAARTVRTLTSELGRWSPEPLQALALVDEDAQAVLLAQLQALELSEPGRRSGAATRGSALLVAELRTLGIPAAQATLAALDGPDVPGVLVVSHLTAWTAGTADRLLGLVGEGRTLLVDGTTGQYDLDAALHRPWPAGLQPLGLRSRGLWTRPTDTPGWAIELFGAPAGWFPFTISDLDLDPDAGWAPLAGLRLPQDGDVPAAWERAWGRGRIIVAVGSLALAAMNLESRPALRFLLAHATDRVRSDHAPVSDHTLLLKVTGESGEAYGVFAGRSLLGDPGTVRVRLPAGSYRDLWNTTEPTHHTGGEVTLSSPDGIALLVRRGS